MKLHTPDGKELMEVQRLERDGDRLIVRGVIMGTMPTRAVIHPENLRAAFGLLSFGLIFNLLLLLLRPGSKPKQS